MNYETKNAALVAGDTAKCLMRDPRAWRLEVWENIGWHWHLCAAGGRIMVTSVQTVGGDVLYWGLINFEGKVEGAGDPEIENHFRGKNPQVVADKLLKAAEHTLNLKVHGFLQLLNLRSYGLSPYQHIQGDIEQALEKAGQKHASKGKPRQTMRKGKRK